MSKPKAPASAPRPLATAAIYAPVIPLGWRLKDGRLFDPDVEPPRWAKRKPGQALHEIPCENWEDLPGVASMWDDVLMPARLTPDEWHALAVKRDAVGWKERP